MSMDLRYQPSSEPLHISPQSISPILHMAELVEGSGEG